ncbi:GNAT family N-acetyltransferase [uncultured Shewanella sp.]|uniref:GNAT family N-acetyltransferase n=1 Tax=uncultured Shewanella sp. TaxID=173975 RepID=UPI002634443E|nr:GNAT family N-acetyltransferase [uncultured Shewanella sp.]
MEQGFKVVRASTEHLDAVAKLFNQYRQFYQQADDLALARSFIGQRIHEATSVIFIALSSQNQPLGFIQLYPTFSSISAKTSLILNDLYVTNHARKRGIGRALMLSAIDYAKSQDVASLSLQTHHENSQAQALYESLLFKKDNEFFSYALDIH